MLLFRGSPISKLLNFSALVFFVITALQATVAKGHFYDFLGDPDVFEFMQNDYYGCLGVPPSASLKTIKKAYRRLSREFHPDRNPDAPKSRFLEIAAANEVLSNAEKKARYDKFLSEIPPRLRPRYGSNKISAGVVSLLAGAMIIGLISAAQVQQFKRDRNRALNSEIYEKGVADYLRKGKSEEEFLKFFIEVNPELLRTWRDSLGWRLLAFPFRFLSRKKSDQVKSADPLQENETDAVSHEDVDFLDEIEEVELPKIPEDASPEERKYIERTRRKLLRRHDAKIKQARERRAAELKRKQTQDRKAKLRDERRAAKEKQAQERSLKGGNSSYSTEERKRLINRFLDSECILKIVSADEDKILESFLSRHGFCNDGELSQSTLTNSIDAIKTKLRDIVELDELSQEAFWCKIFDEVLRDRQKELEIKRIAEQEAYESELRKEAFVLLDQEGVDDDSG